MKNITHILRHKNIDVISLNIKEGTIINVGEIIEKEHLPIKYEEELSKNIYLLNKAYEMMIKCFNENKNMEPERINKIVSEFEKRVVNLDKILIKKIY